MAARTWAGRPPRAPLPGVRGGRGRCGRENPGPPPAGPADAHDIYKRIRWKRNK